MKREIKRFSLPVPDTARCLANGEVEPPLAVIPGALWGGACTLFSGAPKAGKSTMVRDWLRRIHDAHLTYDEVPGMVPTGNVRAANTLILSEEAGWAWADFAASLKGAKNGDADWLKVLHRGHGQIAPTSSSDLNQWVDAVIDQVRVHDIGLVIIDPVTRFGAITSENDNSEVLRAMLALERIASETGAALLLMHHTTKGGHEPRGAGAWMQQPDCLLTLRLLGDKEVIEDEEIPPDRIRVFSGKGRFPEIEAQVAVHMDEDGHYHTMPGAIQRFVSRAESDGERIMTIMRSEDREWTTRELQPRLPDMEVQRMLRALRNLQARNRVLKNGSTKDSTYILYGADAALPLEQTDA